MAESSPKDKPRFANPPAINPLDALLTQVLNRRVTIEQRMADAIRGARPMPSKMELREWAIYLATPDARKTGDLDSHAHPAVQAARIAAQHADDLLKENQRLRQALRFYANRGHLMLSKPDDWDTTSGEPQNYLSDDAGSATLEDGTVAARALRSQEIDWEGQEPAQIDGEAPETTGQEQVAAPAVRIYDYVWKTPKDAAYHCSFTPGPHLNTGELFVVVDPADLPATYLQRQAEPGEGACDA